ncbi:hypothetical protein P4637_20280 [Halalkalibacterium halodurans]|uniref:BH2161 protein n=2 Tax=Halalkalibacterium halodurans TaxID=86665 RepID=Q9KAX5_HALH5|nr:hypothetical protein [Halalkalibacterium halodurans]MDY7222717.1 hypothetical protein [Halalkalibacterium halodurans]MDY7241938.1 hypothetical protein [Halalkalibacterium halodurans]MED3647163.1 hypothetical protein [Halalkalibacterium halodurans]MED4082991.1 hypothetical protein [Halalkalibacterium halodurans]MED4087152.1 hypothetical protein [Halalkalibacterium halodurans]
MDLTVAHWLYLAGTCIIILTMLFRQNVVVPALLMTFLIGWTYSGSFMQGLQTTFNGSLTAAGALFNIFLIIAIMTALLDALKSIGSDKQMIIPFQKVMINGHVSFFILVFVTYTLSLFFWPAPAVPLIGALLIPVAIRSGLPAMTSALAISLAGHGMALSSDFVIQAAPALTATAAGVDVTEITDKTLILSLIAGAVSLLIVYFQGRRHIRSASPRLLTKWEQKEAGSGGVQRADDRMKVRSGRHSFIYACLVPLTFLGIIVYVILATFTSLVPSIASGAGAALIGGIAILLLIAATASYDYRTVLKHVSDHLTNGFVFAFKVMGLVIPIAGFFLIGSNNHAASILNIPSGQDAPAFLFDLVQASQLVIPEHPFVSGFAILILGMISGLDGSGFSGLPLVGTLSVALGHTTGMDVATLASIGQVGAIWVGGGTLVAWSPIIAIAGFAKVPIIEMVRRSFIPVCIGLIVATAFGLLFF